MGVYAVLTDGRGKVQIRMQIVDADESEKPIAVMGGEVDFPDPRAIVEIDLHVANVKIPGPGEYRIQLYANDEFILERRLWAVQLAEKEQQ